MARGRYVLCSWHFLTDQQIAPISRQRERERERGAVRLGGLHARRLGQIGCCQKLGSSYFELLWAGIACFSFLAFLSANHVTAGEQV